jgi:hypothetical protein
MSDEPEASKATEMFRKEIMQVSHVESLDQEWMTERGGFVTTVRFDDNSTCMGVNSTREQSYSDALLAAKTHVASRFGRD